MAVDPFVAKTNQFVRDTKARLEAVFVDSAQDLFAEAQLPVSAGGNMPVDFGFLRNSLQTGLDGEAGTEGEDSYVVALASAKIGQKVVGRWTAVYAAYQHYTIGHLWVDKAVQNWQRIVTKNVQLLQRLRG